MDINDPGPPSPGFSSLLAELAETDDASRMSDDSPLPHQQIVTTAHASGDVYGATGMMGANSVNHGQALPQPGLTLQGITHHLDQLAPYLQLTIGHSSAPPQRCNPVTTPQVAGLHAASACPLPGPTLALGATWQPAPSARNHADGAATTAAPAATAVAGVGNRRGRKPMPRLPDLQQQVDTLTKQFQRLSRENSFLRGKLKLLECVLPYRDSNIGFLASVNNGLPPPAPLPYLPPTSSAAAATADASAAPTPLTASQTETILVNPNAITAATESTRSGSPWPPPPTAAATAPSPPMAPACCALASSSSGSFGDLGGAGSGSGYGASHPPPAAAQSPACGSASGPSWGARTGPGAWRTSPPCHPPGTPAVLALCPFPDGDVPPISAAAAEELRRVTPREFQLYYKHIVMQLAVLATGAEVHGPRSPQAARLERFLDRQLGYWDRVVLLAPDCWVHSMYVNVETGAQERPPDEFWHAVGRSLHLSPDQEEALLTASAIHKSNMAPVAQERLQLASELCATISAAATAHQPPVSSGDVIKSLSEMDEVAERLRRNVIREQQVQADVGDFLCMGVLTPLQIARVMAASYPYIPDGVAIMHAYDTAGGNTHTNADPKP